MLGAPTRENRARLLRFRLLLRLRHLRGRHRSVLGALANHRSISPASCRGFPKASRPNSARTPPRLGWIYQYALVDKSGKHSLSDLRSYQDWYLRYYLRSVPGVAEVAPIGGYTRQYQVNLDPNRLRAYGIPVSRVVEAVRSGNDESSGRLLNSAARIHGSRPRLRACLRILRTSR